LESFFEANTVADLRKTFVANQKTKSIVGGGLGKRSEKSICLKKFGGRYVTEFEHFHIICYVLQIDLAYR
jgi:hypothetical protein